MSCGEHLSSTRTRSSFRNTCSPVEAAVVGVEAPVLVVEAAVLGVEAGVLGDKTAVLGVQAGVLGEDMLEDEVSVLGDKDCVLEA